MSGRVLLEGKSVQIADVLTDPEWAYAEIASFGNFRTILGVPLLREGIPIGIFLLHRTVVRPFNEKQIKLVETFADQAVIAIENTRLFEAEQQRTQTSLNRWSSRRPRRKCSRSSQARPAIFSRYSRPCSRMLCASATQSLEISFVGKAMPSTSSRRTIYRMPSLSFAGAHRFVPVRKIPIGRMVATKAVVHVADLAAEQRYIEDVIQQLLLPSNLGAYGRLWPSRC